jgi:hypothetical protein
MPRVRGSMSQKTRPAPWRANASPVLVKVKDGTITVSPSSRSSSIADSSRAAVHDVVISTSAEPVSARRIAAARRANSPPDAGCPPRIACWT